MPSETSRLYPDAVIQHGECESYKRVRAKYKTPYDLVTDDVYLAKYTRVDRKLAKAVSAVHSLHPKFRGLIKEVSCEFVLRSSITQLGVNAENVEISIDPTARTASIAMDLVALSPLAVLMLDYIGVNSHVGKLFAAEQSRVVRTTRYITRLFESVNQRGQSLLVYGNNTHRPNWDLKIIDGRVVAYLPVLPGILSYSGEIHGLLPTIGAALKTGTEYKDLIRLHQEFHHGYTRLASPSAPLMVRGNAMHFRALFGRVVNELLPEGLRSMSSRVIEPGSGVIQHVRDRTFVFGGASSEELTHIPIEFFTLESYREQVPFELRKTLPRRCSTATDILRVFGSAPRGDAPCTAFLSKGRQFYDITESDWVVADPKQQPYVWCGNPSEQKELIVSYAYQQPEYAILSAIAADDISSDGVLFTRYFVSPCLKSLILSRSVCQKLRAIYFVQASRHYGNFFSQEDMALLCDINNFGILVFQVNEARGRINQYIIRPGRTVGLFVPLERRQEYLDATFFGVYGSNLVAGDFEAELMTLLSGIQHIKKTCSHPLLNASKPLALLTGGGPGAMEVGNRVARSLGILSCGLVVDFGSVSTKPGATINEQHQNPYVEAYFSYRADKLVERQSDFNLDFPIFLAGGYGTDFEYSLEEVRRKVGTVPASPVILFGTPEHWGAKITTRYRENLACGTIKGSEWLCTVPWVVKTGKEALQIYNLFFRDKLPIGVGHPLNDRGFMIASEYLPTVAS